MRGYSVNLDFLRTVAVLAVVLRHLLGALSLTAVGPVSVQLVGIFGVMLFFVHTAHVLMFSLDRLTLENTSHLARRFFIKRAFRIYPLSILIVLAGSALTTWYELPGFNKLSASATLANLVLIQNVTGSINAIGPLWSLPIEVQMYLFLPAIFRLTTKGKAVAATMYLAFVALALVTFFVPSPDVLRFAPCFIPGIIAYVLVVGGSKQFLSFWALPAVLTGGLYAYGILGSWSQTIGAYPVCLLVGLVIPFVRDSRTRWLNESCKTIAKYSFGVYLFHDPALTLCFNLPLPLPVKVVTFACLTAMLSVFAYRYIEAPFINLGRRFSTSPLPGTSQ